jgi:hypothetical protein
VGEHLLCKQGVVGSIPSTSMGSHRNTSYSDGVPIGEAIVAEGKRDRVSIERRPDGAVRAMVARVPKSSAEGWVCSFDM